MAAKPVPATEAEYAKAQEVGDSSVQRVEVPIPGATEPVIQFFKVEYVDDLTGKPEQGTKTVQLRVPVEKEEEVTETDDDGEPLKNRDGTDKITVRKYIGYENLEVDLGPASFARLERALAPFVAAARPATEPDSSTSGNVARKTGKSTPNPELAEWNRRVRYWLNNSPKTPVKKNEDVPPKGRIKAVWEAAYIEAHPEDPKPGSLA
jgi:hypothetical protein